MSEHAYNKGEWIKFVRQGVNLYGRIEKINNRGVATVTHKWGTAFVDLQNEKGLNGAAPGNLIPKKCRNLKRLRGGYRFIPEFIS